MTSDQAMTTGPTEIPGNQISVARHYGWWKIRLDWTVAMLASIVAAPVILLLLFAVRLTSRGAPLYRQKRLGAGGRVFTIFKIRTMYQDSEAHGRPVWSGPGDPRVTPLGRILRATHLDELPQLWNVLRGDMSLIGPRPERPEIAASLELAVPRYAERLQVRPGLSGLAQVLQGPDFSLLSVKSKLEYDLYYLENFGLWLDCRIVLATICHLTQVPSAAIARVFKFPVFVPNETACAKDLERLTVAPLQLPEFAK